MGTHNILQMDQSGHVSKKRDFKAKNPRSSESLRDLGDVGIVELLENDQRPTFLLDIGAHPSSDGTDPHLVYYNEALRSAPVVLEQIQSLYKSVNGTRQYQSSIFRDWTLDSADPPRNGQTKFYKSFQSFVWTAVAIRSRWRLFSGLPNDSTDGSREDDSDRTLSSSAAESDPEALGTSQMPERSGSRPLDWTVPNSFFEASPHIEWVRNFDWASTPLGGMQSWPYQLRLIINLLMADPSPAVVYWGQELTTIYNEAYIPVFHSKHPWALGRPFGEVYADLASDLEDFYETMWENGRERGKATAAEGQRFIMAMHSERPEEVFFSYAVLPVVGGNGCVEGFFTTFRDVTNIILATRRIAILRAATDANAKGSDPDSFWRKWVDVLSNDEHDIASVIAYSVRSAVSASSMANAQSVDTTVLEAFSAVPVDDREVPHAHELLRKDAQFMAAFDKALRTGEPQSYDIHDSALANTLVLPDQSPKVSGIPRQLALCPTNPELPAQGVFVISINPLRPYDVDYQDFVANLAGEISASLTASEKARFAEQAIIQSELRFSQMTATSAVGHFEISLEGQILYVNDRWHSITGMPRPGHEMAAMSWLQLVYEPDLPIIHCEWARLQGGEAVSFEIRLKKEWQAVNPFSGETLELEVTWVLAMASQHATTTGPTIMGCLVDINRQKWAEDFHKRKTEEAIQMKVKQERFIDMTSHEMRNPLSAIFQCSDSIVSLLESALKKSTNGDVVNETRSGTPRSDLSESLTNCIEAAQTISFCAQHQKRIVDDVLLLSKMDANMIEVTAVDSNPKEILEKGLSIFASELRANDIRLEFRIEESYKELGIEWVRLDPSRLLQILINLTTNALKFTLYEARERKIVVSLGASTTPPLNLSSDDARFTFLPPSGDIVDPTLRPEWGSGQPVYLHVSVEDTGRGISEAEMRELFMRFKQASPRTHVEYGGSGLGLHIARQLAEMQGGQIGVTSERGKGSTFAFYIKARRCNPSDILLPTPRANSMSFAGRKGSVLAPPTQESQLSQVSGESTPMRETPRLNILIVEDNLVNQKVLSKQLRKLGWNVSVANHGQEALEALKESVFWNPTIPSKEGGKPLDLVLMDIEMPVMDGLTATKEIRRLQAEGLIKGHVPIIAVSANARSEQISKATAAGIVSTDNLHVFLGADLE
jgi:PAS domain S-box-containing protein